MYKHLFLALILLVLLDVLFLHFSPLRDLITSPTTSHVQLRTNDPTSMMPDTSTVQYKQRWAAFADIQSDLVNLEKALQDVLTHNIQKIVIVGDLTTVGSKAELQAVNEVLDKYHTAHDLNFQVLPGDHDIWAAQNSSVSHDAYITEYMHKYLFYNTYSNHSDYVEASLNTSTIQADNSLTINKYLASLSDDPQVPHILYSHKKLFSHNTTRIYGDTDQPDQQGLSTKSIQNMAKIKESCQKYSQTIISGDLHNFEIEQIGQCQLVSVGAITASRNFQNPRYAIISITQNNSIIINDTEI
jgi:predicted phosphodiesterase